jgi:hypothetical protein
MDLYGFSAVSGDWEQVAREGESVEEVSSKGRTTASAASHGWRKWVTRGGGNAEEERIQLDMERWRPARFFHKGCGSCWRLIQCSSLPCF